MYGMVLECTGFEADAQARVTQVLAQVLRGTKSGYAGVGSVKVERTITWLSVHG